MLPETAVAASSWTEGGADVDRNCMFLRVDAMTPKFRVKQQRRPPITSGNQSLVVPGSLESRPRVTINGSVFQLSSYQSFSYSAFSFSAVQVTTQASTPNAQSVASEPANSVATPSEDTVTLSPHATTQASAATTDSSTATTEDAAPPAASLLPTSTNDRAAALFKALDANQDGSVTEDEFKAGAKALLRRGRENDRAEGPHHSERGHHGGRRLERALERAFDRVDSDGDGSLTKDELAAALSPASKSATQTATTPTLGVSADSSSAASGNSVDGSAQKVTSTFVSLTVVSIAIRTYTAVSQFSASNASTTNANQTEGAASTGSPAPADTEASTKVSDPLLHQQ